MFAADASAGAPEQLADSPEGSDLAPDTPTPDGILEDLTIGLDRVQRLLDEQDDRLGRLESATTLESTTLSVLRDVVYRSLVTAWGDAGRENPGETVTVKGGAYTISVTELDPGGRVRATISTPGGRVEKFQLDFGNNPRTLETLMAASSATAVESDDGGVVSMNVDGLNVTAELNLKLNHGDGQPDEIGIEWSPDMGPEQAERPASQHETGLPADQMRGTSLSVRPLSGCTAREFPAVNRPWKRAMVAADTVWSVVRYHWTSSVNGNVVSEPV